MICPLDGHKGARPCLIVRYDRAGNPTDILCSDYGAPLSCSFRIRRASVGAEEWERWYRFITQDVEVAYYDSGVGNSQI